MFDRITPFAHRKIKEIVNKNDIVIDMTAGNGNDTLFLSKIAKHVYSFDIQEPAIQVTRNLLDTHSITNVTLIHDGHQNIDQYIKDKIKCAVYNLGYLPSADKSISTLSSTTLDSIKKTLNLIMIDGFISITVYTGHKEGYEESLQLTEFVTSLPSKLYNVILYSTLNKKNAPYNIFIEKIGEKNEKNI